jgi:hypothetical protein
VPFPPGFRFPPPNPPKPVPPSVIAVAVTDPLLAVAPTTRTESPAFSALNEPSTFLVTVVDADVFTVVVVPSDLVITIVPGDTLVTVPVVGPPPPGFAAPPLPAGPFPPP